MNTPNHRRIIIALILAAGLTAALLGFGLARYRELVGAQQSSLHTYRVLVALERLDGDIDNDRGLALCAMTGNRSARPSAAEVGDVDHDLRQMHVLLQDNPEQLARLEVLESRWHSHLREYVQPMRAWCEQDSRLPRPDREQVLALSQHGAVLRPAVHAQVDVLRRAEQSLLASRGATTSTLQAGTGWLLLMAVVIAGFYLLATLLAAARAAQALATSNRALQEAITRRDQAVAELTNSEYAIRTLFDQIPEVIAIVGPDGRLESANATAEEFGWSAGERADGALHLPGVRVESDTYIEALANAEGVAESYEFSRVRLPGSHGRRYLFVGRNIEERQKLERAKSEFLSTISHELRTPLTSLRAALSLLADEEHSEFTGDNARMLRLAHLNAENLARLVNDVVDMERLASQQVQFAHEPVALATCLAEVMEMAESFAWVRDVQVRLEPVPAQAVVMADSQRLAQVVTNLLANAIKFTAPDTEVRLRATIEGAVARIEVIDQGPGIPPEFEARVFQRFARADGSNTRTHGGSGLGLSIAKGMVEQMGGRIGYRNLDGGGCLFWVELPRAPA